MKNIIYLILVGISISCSSSKIEKDVLNDFLSKELITNNSEIILVEEALPKLLPLQYYENAYNERNLHEGEIHYAPNGYPPYNWEVNSAEINVLKQKHLKDTLRYFWKKSDFKNQKLKIISAKTIKKRGSNKVGEKGIYLSRPILTVNKKYAFLFYKSFTIEIGFSNEKAVLLKKVNGKWTELYHYNDVMTIN